MDITHFSGFARPVDPSYRTNLAIVIISGLSGLLGSAYYILTGNHWLDSILTGGLLAISVFLTWALARELDPDHPISAFVGLPATIILFFWVETPHLIPLFALILMLRLVSRITGKEAKWPDSLLLLGLGIYLAWAQEYILSLGVGVAFALDGWLVYPIIRHRYLAGLSIFTTLIIAYFQGVNFGWDSIPFPYGFALINLIFVLVIFADYKTPKTLTDNKAKQLTASRIQTAQLLAFMVMLLAIFLESSSNLFLHSPFWAAITGINLHFLFRRIRQLG